MNTFSKFINNPLFLSKDIVLLLNKEDVFREKLNYSPITSCFPEYTGLNTFKETSSYIKSQFKNLNKSLSREFHIALTNAIDVENLKITFSSLMKVIAD